MRGRCACELGRGKTRLSEPRTPHGALGSERAAGLRCSRERAVWRRLLLPTLLQLLEIVFCLVHIFQANLVCLMAHPKLAFYVACSVYLISTSTFFPQKFVAERILTWDLRTRSVPSLCCLLA